MLFLLFSLFLGCSAQNIRNIRIRPISYADSPILNDTYLNTIHSRLTNITNNVNIWFKAVSYNKLKWNFIIDKPVVISSKSNNCDFYNIFNYTDPLYPFTLSITIQQNMNCPWFGLASVGKAGEYPGSGFVYVNGLETYNEDYRYVQDFIHELGHNLGLLHESLWSCSDLTTLDTVKSKCISMEYRDPIGAMGLLMYPGIYNAIYKERLGWIKSTLITKSGKYQLSAIELSGNNIKALKILKHIKDPSVGNVPTYYYIEYRQPNKAEAVVCSGNNIGLLAKGVFIHFGNPTNPTLMSNILKLNPKVSFNLTAMYSLNKLNPFVDVSSHIKISLVSSNKTSSIISVIFT